MSQVTNYLLIPVRRAQRMTLSTASQESIYLMSGRRTSITKRLYELSKMENEGRMSLVSHRMVLRVGELLKLPITQPVHWLQYKGFFYDVTLFVLKEFLIFSERSARERITSSMKMHTKHDKKANIEAKKKELSNKKSKKIARNMKITSICTYFFS